MWKSYSIFFVLLISHMNIYSSIEPCTLAVETVERSDDGVHEELKRLISEEMLNIPKTIRNREQLKEIWFRNGYRDRIQKIISKKTLLTHEDLLDLRSLISQEKRILSPKIKQLIDTVNQDTRTTIYEALKFKKSEHEIEDTYKKSELSADKLIQEEYQLYNTILKKIDQLNNTRAYNKELVA